MRGGGGRGKASQLCLSPSHVCVSNLKVRVRGRCVQMYYLSVLPSLLFNKLEWRSGEGWGGGEMLVLSGDCYLIDHLMLALTLLMKFVIGEL